MYSQFIKKVINIRFISGRLFIISIIKGDDFFILTFTTEITLIAISYLLSLRTIINGKRDFKAEEFIDLC